MRIGKKIQKLTLSAMFAAIIFVATAFLQVPLPGSGYANFGDSIIFTACLVLGPWYGAAAAAIGAAVSDIFLGFVVYAPATFVIKALMAILAYYVFNAVYRKKTKRFLPAVITASAAAEIVMIAGYFLFEILIYGMAVALVDVAGNALQGAAGVISGTIIYCALNKSGIFKNIK